MLKVGLTGGIGSGKSTVARRLAELGACVVDSDVLAREVAAPGGDGLARVRRRFGDGVITADGSLDRPALASAVFGDDAARADLEGILHPLIAERTAQVVAAAPPDAIVVHDVPLLVEKHMGPGYHLVVVVDAPAAVRLERLVGERGMGEADARARMEHQANDDTRRAAADVLLPNGGSREELVAAVHELWHERLRPFEENVRLGRPFRRPDTPVLVDYDPGWPHAARRIVDRLGAALGDRAPEIEHVGSTAVPGMPGKDVIDVQIGVSRLADADDPDFMSTMADLGFPRIDDYRMDHPTEDLPDPSLWVKRFHASCDPGRVVHVHVRELGSAGWQYALLFRDFLRADPEAAAEYVDVKDRLRRESSSSADYAEAKAPWFGEIWPRIQAWAQRSGWHD
ncbi:dephospho-CoA kinase [Agilicoccus flavus]|uniref:dephospho-CoA kinase n=1 Tax=Agilicoccus flavus TaxID=2775968 RepID=UPI001CF61ED8|nr:dephospho-CoA kinase [Agilicoccus flavus]